MSVRLLALVAAVVVPLATSAQQSAPQAAAQQPRRPAPTVLQLARVTVCGAQLQPRSLPPDGSGPVVLFIAPCFEAQGRTSLIKPETYLYYIHLEPSRPSEGVWMPYDKAAEATIREDSQRLLATSFLDNVSVETKDYAFPNGVVGKIVLYNMVERRLSNPPSPR